MKIKKIEISLKEKYFLEYNGLSNQTYKSSLDKEKTKFLEENKNIELIENREVSGVDINGKVGGISDQYSGYYLKYYEGILLIEGIQEATKTSMNIKLTKSVMDLVLKEAGGEIKELVKKEYEEFERQLLELIERTEKKNPFGNFVISKFKKIKEVLLNNTKNV